MFLYNIGVEVWTEFLKKIFDLCKEGIIFIRHEANWPVSYGDDDGKDIPMMMGKEFWRQT